MSVGHLDHVLIVYSLMEHVTWKSPGPMCEAFARILKSHGIATANRPHRTLRNFVIHPKDKVRDEEKTELIYCVPCKNCSSSYVGEIGRKFSLRINEHKKEVDSFTAGTQTRASSAMEQGRSSRIFIGPAKSRSLSLPFLPPFPPLPSSSVPSLPFPFPPSPPFPFPFPPFPLPLEVGPLFCG